MSVTYAQRAVRFSLILHVQVNLDRICTQTGELASRLGLPTSQVEPGRVPDWNVDGVRGRLRNKQPVLVIGDAFDTLSPTERQGALAEATLDLHLYQTGCYRPLLAATLLAAVPFLALLFLGGGAIATAMAPWQWGLAFIAAHIVFRIVARLVWARYVIYRIDRRMVQVLGREVVDVVLDLDARSRARTHGAVGVVVKLSMPSKARRAKRLGPDILQSQPAS